MNDPSIKAFKITMLFIGVGILNLLWVVELPDMALDSLNGQIELQDNELKEGLVLIQGNTLIGSSLMPNAIQGQVLGDIVSTAKEVLSWEEQITIIHNKYPDMADLLVCIVWKESWGDPNICENGGYCDNGKAFGSFQIWPSVNNITEECANNFECALDWTVKEIKKGNGWKWTTMKKCLTTK